MGEKKKTAHQALYRKYRSKSLSEIVGQEHITKTLENAIKQSKISHAYLFTGPRGTGKTSIARILAHAINELPYEDEKTHLDIIEIDAASNRRIDDIRDLRDKVHIAPIAAKYKVYIIDEVHMLTNESFNALLKTLEEPPEHVIFILATTEVHKLPATIVSRTQRHSFRLISPEKVVEHLAHIAKQEGIVIDKPALTLLAEHGGGSFRDSISLLDQLSSSNEPIDSALVELLLGLAPKTSLQDLLTAATTGDSTNTLTSIEALAQSGLTPSGIASQLLKLLRENAKKRENKTTTVKLMNDLLTVHNAQYPQLKLETILLGIAPSTAPTVERAAAQLPHTKPVSKPVIVPTQEKSEEPFAVPKQEAKSTKPKKSDKKEEPKPIIGAADGATIVIEDHWPEILEITKQKNNPLYTVLRLATAEIDSEGLLLIFSFPFHQKKIDETKYKSLIAQIIQEVTGASFTIRTIVDKARAKPVNASTAAPQDPAHASLISSVQDIMGGGEIVNV